MAQSGDFSYSVILGKGASATANCQFVVGSIGTPVGIIGATYSTPTQYWEIIINGVVQRILLA